MSWKFSDNQPIYIQIIQKIQQRIVSGQYCSGDKLPSVRDLATEAAVNPNTMQKALGEMERSGLVYSQRTAGRFITNDLLLIKQTRDELAQETITFFLKQMLDLNFQKKEILEFVHKIVEKEI